MKIRIIGLPDEVIQAADIIAAAFVLIEISDPYPCRGASRNLRLYAEVRLPQPPTERSRAVRPPLWSA